MVSLPPAYTTRFLLATGYTGGRPYVVPSGMLAVIRHMDLSLSETFELTTFRVKINTVTIYLNSLITTEGYAFWDGYAVMGEGDQLDVISSVGAMDVQITGYLFTMP